MATATVLTLTKSGFRAGSGMLDTIALPAVLTITAFMVKVFWEGLDLRDGRLDVDLKMISWWSRGE